MLLDATLAFLHFTAILLVAAFLAAEAMLLRGDLGANDLATLVRSDIGYAIAAVLALATGAARMAFGAKGPGFYTDNPLFWTKLAVFLAIGLVSIRPTLAYLGWRRAARAGAGFAVPAPEIRTARRYVLVELHLLALLPLAAVLMARGVGHG
jgi:putative membrane protein